MRTALAHIGLGLLTLSILGCSTPLGSRPADVVVIMRIGTGKEFAPLPPRMGPQTTWTNVALSSPGLSGGLSLIAPDPSSGPLAPDTRRVSPPEGWSIEWLRWPVELAASPEELTWAPHRLPDLPSGRTLHLAAFTGQAFAATGLDWIDGLPLELRPGNAPWIVIDLPSSAASNRVFDAEPVRRGMSATVHWFGPGVETTGSDARLAQNSIAENLSRLVSGRTLRPIEVVNLDVEPTPLDLWIYVQGGAEIEFVDLEIRTPDRVLGRRAIGFEDIDGFADDGPGVQQLRVAVSADGDAAVYTLESLRRGLWFRTHSEFRAGGILGVPFFAGPTGQSLGIGELQVAPGSSDFHRLWSPHPPQFTEATHLPAGVHLWLVPRSETD